MRNTFDLTDILGYVTVCPINVFDAVARTRRYEVEERGMQTDGRAK
jgi:hypothetical protein